MAMADVNGIQIYYDQLGAGPPVLLLTGLGGAGKGWGSQVEMFARDFTTIVPDHRGTGGSSKLESGYTIEAHAEDMAQLLRHLDVGAAHVVGSSTGGAIAQIMALDHPDVVESISLVSSWARADHFFGHQFAVRKNALLEQGTEAYAETSALFLFSPRFFRSNYDEVRAWCDRSRNGSIDIMAQRIDMILAFDALDRIADIDTPTLVLVGAADGCTPPQFSEELSSLIPGAVLEVLDGGHLIYKEKPEEFHAAVTSFIGRI